ncbi:hypothetical protein [Actinoplanes aureus]|uniref:Uncharacterized protein n=1 Tax=Actinoplanes aureus TaxID=2792083 RepID=A0A931G7M4_9ACTN|nr:hypothetical protein [Actinoplanes aureus]MBG0568409.1 hypothetical protein [Actinoplanes aureus]
MAIKMHESFSSISPELLFVEVAVSIEKRSERSELKAELLRLEFLRDHVFTDAALGRIWWMSQRPELVDAVGSQIFLDTLHESAAAQLSDSQLSEAELLPLLIDFVTWLSSGEKRAELAIELFATTLATVGRTDLQERLDRIRTEGPQRSE